MNIIGVNGFKRSGKGETAKIIDEFLLGVRQVGFADKLKIYAAKSLGYLDLSNAECIALMDDAKETWTLPVMRHVADTDYGEEWEQLKEVTGRELLQHMGTQARKVFGDDFWVDQVLPQPWRPGDFGSTAQLRHANDLKVANRYPGVDTLVFTDMRFENEAQRIMDLGGFNIRISRPGAESDGHDSELVLPDHYIKHEIPNFGSLEDLKWEVNKTLELEGLMS